jgi:serine/threonine protein kinase
VLDRDRGGRGESEGAASETSQVLSAVGNALDPNPEAKSHSTVSLSVPLPAGTRTGLPIVAGCVVKHYEIIRQLGQGAMGGVFLARDTRLARLCAIKFMLASGGAGAVRLLAEAQATACCKHECIVTIYEVDEVQGHPYMVLEYLEGRTLRSWMAARGAGDLAPDVVLDLMVPVVRALVYAHDMGIVHRDLKPENVFVTDSGQVKVLDFGVAKRIGASEMAAASAPLQTLPVDPGLTMQGTLIGTRPYMSPEQWIGSDITPQSDIWAVGVILYELVTGSHPLGPSSIARLVEVQDLDLAMPSVKERRPDVGPLGAIIDRCLKKYRSERIGSARELLEELERLVRSKRSAHRRRYRRVAALVTASAAVLTTMLIIAGGTDWARRSRPATTGSAITDVTLESPHEVDLLPVDVPNPGFELPTLGNDEHVRHITAGSAEAALQGWHGSVELLRGHRPARGNQIVSLSDSKSCGAGGVKFEFNYLGRPLLLPRDTYCVLRFAHGVYQGTSATFDVHIGDTVHHFLSTHDPLTLEEEVIRFRTGNSASTQLRFQSTSTTLCGGPTIDDAFVSCARMTDHSLPPPRYLGSDIAALDEPSVGWGSYQVDSNWYGPGFKIGGIPYDKGIFAHAPSEVQFSLGGIYSMLNLCVGQDDVDAVGGDGSRVTVYGDGNTLWTIAINYGGVKCMPPKRITGVQILKLTADPLDGIFGDTVEWVNAFVQ